MANNSEKFDFEYQGRNFQASDDIGQTSIYEDGKFLFAIYMRIIDPDIDLKVFKKEFIQALQFQQREEIKKERRLEALRKGNFL